MKLNEIFSDHEMNRMMLQLVQSAGFEARSFFHRGRRTVTGLIGKKTFRIMLDKDQTDWVLDLISGQGHKTPLGKGDEVWVIEQLNKLKSQVKEDGDSLLLSLIQKYLDEGAVIYIDAHGKTFQSGSRTTGLKTMRTRAHGQVKELKHDNIVYDFMRDRDPKERVDSSSFFVFEQPVDEHYTLKKLGPNKFEIVDAVPVKEAKAR